MQRVGACGYLCPCEGLAAALGVTAAMTALSVYFLRGRLREP